MTIERSANLGVFDAARIQRIAAETQRRTKARRGNDFVIPRTGLAIGLLGEGSGARLAVEFKNGKEHVVPIKRSALQQVAASADVPIRFLDRLLDRGHADLAAATLSEILQREHETESGRARKHLVRSLDGEVDAFLSDSYRALPNDAILSVALEAFEEAKVQVWDLRITDTDFSVLAAAPHISGKVTTDRKFSGARWEGREGDVLNAALRIKNSETGHSRLALSSAILRRVCQNFNVWADVVAKTHLGRRLSEGEIDLSLETKSLEDQALVSGIRDAIKQTFDPREFARTLDKINQTTTRELGEAPTVVVDAAIKVYGLDEGRRESIIERLLRSGDKSQYGLVQSVTAQVNPENAKDLGDATRSAFEEAGGKLLALGDRDWTSFLKSAYAAKAEKDADKVASATQTVARV